LRFFMTTFGCRSNRCDAEWISSSLRGQGWVVVNSPREADLIIINTCAVTHEAAREARQAIRRTRKKNPHGIVVACGCAVQADPVAFLSMPELDYTADMAARGELPKVASRLEHRTSPQPIPGPNGDHDPFPIPDESAPVEQGRARAVLKIQEGCDNECSYCIVTRIRGRSRSLPPHQVLKQLERLGETGHSEVVLTGIHLGHWGRDLLPPSSLEDLLKIILERKPVHRVRLSSIDPTEVSSGLMNLLAQENILCPHLHLPLQSGSNDILKAMNRNYTVREAAARIRLLRQAVPDMAIGLDIIVGFPGETEEKFRETLKTLEEIPFDYLHVFPFSPRPGTKAAGMSGVVPRKVVRERGQVLRELSARRRMNFWKGQLGVVRESLIESPRQDGTGWRGRTDNYIPVIIGRGNYWVGDILPVRLVKAEERRVLGEVGE